METFDVLSRTVGPPGYFCICGTASYRILEGISEKSEITNGNRKCMKYELFGIILQFRDQLSRTQELTDLVLFKKTPRNVNNSY